MSDSSSTNALSVWRTIKTDRFLVGVPHYPEHVDESYWERDAERMAEAGFNVVRLGEFAWHLFEPQARAPSISICSTARSRCSAATASSTIMCTPTATPPRWLTVGPSRRSCGSTATAGR